MTLLESLLDSLHFYHRRLMVGDYSELNELDILLSEYLKILKGMESPELAMDDDIIAIWAFFNVSNMGASSLEDKVQKVIDYAHPDFCRILMPYSWVNEISLRKKINIGGNEIFINSVFECGKITDHKISVEGDYLRPFVREGSLIPIEVDGAFFELRPHPSSKAMVRDLFMANFDLVKTSADSIL